MYRFGSVTGIPLVLPVLHGREPEPSSFGRRCRRRRRMIAAFQRKAEAPKGPDVTYSVFHELSDLSSGLSPSSIPVGQSKGRPFYGQSKGQLCPTWQSYAGLPPEEGASVTGCAVVSPVLHGRESEPPFQGKGAKNCGGAATTTLSPKGCQTLEP